eukprot:3946502-Pleurochrysis_carterae.AAC.1
MSAANASTSPPERLTTASLGISQHSASSFPHKRAHGLSHRVCFSRGLQPAQDAWAGFAIACSERG